jgi:hypothetical protein
MKPWKDKAVFDDIARADDVDEEVRSAAPEIH